MFGKRLSRALAATTVLSLVMTAAAFADVAVSDGDNATPVASNSLALGDVCRDATSTGDSLLAISRNGNYGSPNVFKKGSSVTWSVVAATTTAGLSATFPDGAAASIPGDWDEADNNDMSPELAVEVHYAAPDSAGAFSGTITFRATGVRSDDTTLTRDAAMTVTANRVTCAPPDNVIPQIAWSANPAAANEGDTNTYSFSITDSDSSSWSFVSGSPSCGTGGALVADSDSITGTSGTFQCHFADGPASPSVSAQVSDGTDNSNTLTQSVTVSNVKPTPVIGSLTGNSGVACIAGNTVTLGFSWTDPALANDTYSYSVSWGDLSAATTGSNATSPVSNVQHTYAAGGPYTIGVTVNDEDPGAANSAATSAAFSFLYNASGVLQPVNDTQAQNDPSVFKYGSTIPVKIRITDCNGASVSGLSPQIAVKKLSGSTPPTGVDETIASTSGADSGTTMRYDALGGIYIYNLATKSLADSSATYEIRITGPFATVTTQFGTRAK